MSDTMLPLAIWMQLAYADLRDRARDAWAHRADEDGVDEAVTKMIWLAVGIAVAVAATAFFVNVFNSAKSSVPDPVAPTP
jgi:hypothetical protein